ncbi:MAG: SUMF1/EgtB/PvdO family nonheme iron enzyme [Deltaproteobacteria bacterium]|nr:SUMF1/EgtB/PvdO family nonheme iron enzyme [Deltaproteobacteria bacterium]
MERRVIRVLPVAALVTWAAAAGADEPDRDARERASEALLQGAVDAYDEARFADAAGLLGQALPLSDRPVIRIYLGSALAYLRRCEQAREVLAPVDPALPQIQGAVQRKQAIFMLKSAAVLCLPDPRGADADDDGEGTLSRRDEPARPAPPDEGAPEALPAPAPATVAPPAAMVPVPGGAFWMGCAPADKACTDDEDKLKVRIGPFRIDRTEVTVAAYRRCVESGACTPTSRGPACNAGRDGREDHPVNCVSWRQAAIYCAWAGRRLPTEAEWEKAARGGRRTTHPWGDRRPDCTRAVSPGCNCGEGTCPAGSRPRGASPGGALDMIGNVWEYVSDWYARDRDPADRKDPEGPGTGNHRVVKGGSYDEEFGMRVSYRSWLQDPVNPEHVGFRCALPGLGR